MDNNVIDSDVRVTRSLRKRLTSVDSDNSSRPGTPISTKLTSISENSNSPCRSTRMTRRNSTSGIGTPVKTPGKRGSNTPAIIETVEVNTPVRKSTRKRSTSIQENEEISQTNLKTPTVNILDEDKKPIRITRSLSKSPQDKILITPSSEKNKIPNEGKSPEIKIRNIKSDSSKKRKPGPKSKTREYGQLEDDSDVEINIFENEYEIIKTSKSLNVTTITLTDEDSFQTTFSNKEEREKNTTKDDLALSPLPNFSKEKKTLNMNDVQLKENNHEEKIVTENLEENIDKNSIEEENQKTPTVFESEKNENLFEQIMHISNDKAQEKNIHYVKDDVEKNNEYKSGEASLQQNRINVSSYEAVEFKEDSNLINYTITPEAKEKSVYSDKFEIIDCTILSNRNTPEAKEKTLTSDQFPNVDCTTLKDCPTPDTKDKSRKSEKLEMLNITTLEIKEKPLPSDKFGTALEVKENSLPSNKIEIVDGTTLKNCTSEGEREKPLPSNKFEIVENLALKESNTVGEKEKLLPSGKPEIALYTTPKAKENILPSDKFEIAESSPLKNCTTPKAIDKRVASKSNEVGSDSILSDSVKTLLKKVDFDSSPSNDKAIKSVYPKTPVSAKVTKHDGSFQTKCNSMADIVDNNQSTMSENGDNEVEINSKEQEEETHIIESKITSIRAENATLVNVEISKQEDLLSVTGGSTIFNISADEQIIDTVKAKISSNITLDEDNNSSVNENELKWINPCVKKISTDGSKLDIVTKHYDKNINDSRNNAESSVKKIPENEKQNIIFSSEDEEEQEQIQKSEDDDGEELYQPKHEFHDDAAMEVNLYESGDSMDSEERLEIEENEIPVDVESIGSQTTDEDPNECVEEADSADADSFVVSDSEQLKFFDCDFGEDEVDEHVNDQNRQKTKKSYKRLRPPADDSSDEDDNNNDHKVIQKSLKQHEKLSETNKNTSEKNNFLSESKENIILDSSKLSESALRLQCSDNSESEEEESNTLEISVSRKEILRNINQSEHFNKSVRDLNPDVDVSLNESMENMSQDKNNEANAYTKEDETFMSPNSNKKQLESLLGEVSVTSESDAEKENDQQTLLLPVNEKNNRRLSASISNNTNINGKQECQRSFIIDITFKDGELEAAVTDLKSEKANISTSSSPTDCQESEELKNEVGYVDNFRHTILPLGNPLVRTRRQSLALPTNPDMEIFSCQQVGGEGKKIRRTSLGVLSSNDFNPSQSFIDSIELQKNKRNRLAEKRKRLSKSFCGTSDTYDNSIIDIDVRHLHKRSKLVDENRVEDSHNDSIDNINTSKLFAKPSSTPHEKVNKKFSSNSQHILTRCNEILEAANKAKLEAKIKNKKVKTKSVKKQHIKKSVLTLEESNSDESLTTSGEIERKDKTKTAVSQAVMAANLILCKREKLHPNMDQEDLQRKPLVPDAIKAIKNSSSIKKKSKGTIHKQGKIKNVHSIFTAAGNFVEHECSPEKKLKKRTYIQLPTGKVSVEPLTPKKRSIHAFNGVTFMESSVTPYAAGFKVEKIYTPKDNASFVRAGKRKRYCSDEFSKDNATSKPQWTQSGVFTEEETSKTEQKTHYPNAFGGNFKEMSINRPNIRRSTKRERFLLGERRQLYGAR